MGSTYVAKIKSFTDSIVVNGKNAIQVQIEWTDKGSGNYESDLTIKLGDREEYVYFSTTNLVEEFSFIIPVDWLNAIPETSIDSGTITVKNLNMNTLQEEKITKRFTVYVPEEFAPSKITNFSLNFRDAKSNLVDYALYGVTIPEISATVKSHETTYLKKWHLSGGGTYISGNFSDMNIDGYGEFSFGVSGKAFRTWGNITLTLTVEDARGRTESIETEEFYIQEYNRPLINNLSAYRVDEGGEADTDGKYIKVNASATPSSIKNSNEDNVNTLMCYLSWKKTTDSSYSAGIEISNKEPYIFAADNGLNYDIRLTVKDKYRETVAYCSVLGDGKDFNIAEGGGGAAIGTKAQNDYFDVAYNSRFQKNIGANGEISSNKGIVSYGTGSKGDFLSFGEATRIAAYVTPGGSYFGDDFNNYTQIGLYAVYTYKDFEVSNPNTTEKAVIENVPCQSAGTLRVYYANGTSGKYDVSRYIIQEYVVYDGTAVYRRCVWSYRATPESDWDNWQFGPWYKYAGTKV